jgi:hypothetical protein
VAFLPYDFVRRAALVRGDDFRRRVRWSAGEPPVPVDMTGWTGEFQLFRPGEDVPFFTSPLGLGADGWITFAVPHATTLTIPRGEYLYAAKLTDTLGVVQSRMRGRLEALP